MKRVAILALALALVSIGVVMVADLTPVWLTEGVRVFALVMLPTAIVAALLVLYFDWRGRLMRRVQAEDNPREDLASGLPQSS